LSSARKFLSEESVLHLHVRLREMEGLTDKLLFQLGERSEKNFLLNLELQRAQSKARQMAEVGAGHIKRICEGTHLDCEQNLELFWIGVNQRYAR